MADSTVTVSQLICDFLADVGVEHVFGIPGDYSITFCHAVSLHPRVKYVGVSSEHGCALAADSYARRRGFACVTTAMAIGDLSCANACAGMNAEGIPALFVTGVPCSTYKRAHHMSSADDLFSSCKAFEPICAQTLILGPNNLDKLIPFLQRAPNLTGPSALFVECQTQATKVPAWKYPSTESEDTANGEKLADALYNRVKAAKKSLVVLGFEVAHLGGSALAYSFTKALCDEFPNTLTLANNFLHTGIVDHTQPQLAASFVKLVEDDKLKEYDFTLALGFSYNDTTSCVWTLPQLQEEISYHRISLVENMPSKISRVHYMMKAMLKKLNKPIEFPQNLPARTFKAPAQDDQMSLAGFASVMSTFFRPGDIVLREIGTSSCSIYGIDLPPAVTVHYQEFYFLLGWSSGGALGMALADDTKNRIIAFTGDGAFQMAGHTLASLSWKVTDRPVYIILFNNRGYLIERLVGDGEFNEVPPMDYVAYGYSQGAHFVNRCSKLSDLYIALQNEKPGVHLIEIDLPKHSTLHPENDWKFCSLLRKTNKTWWNPNYDPSFKPPPRLAFSNDTN